MKRRNLILSFVIVALMLIGVGFAVASQTLTIEGDMDALPVDADFKVVFVNDTKDPATYTVDNVDAHKASVSVDLSSANHTGKAAVSVTLNIENQSEYLDAELSNVVVTNEGPNAKYFNVTAALDGAVDGAVTVNAGGKATITLTFYIAVLPESDKNATFTVEFTATPLDEDTVNA